MEMEVYEEIKCTHHLNGERHFSTLSIEVLLSTETSFSFMSKFLSLSRPTHLFGRNISVIEPAHITSKVRIFIFNSIYFSFQ